SIIPDFMRIRNFLLRLFALFLLYYPTWSQQTFPQNGAFDERPGIYAFTNATIVADPATVHQEATLLVENGRISALGKHINLPKGAVIIDLKGKYIYPSFIELLSSYGMPEVKKPESSGRQAPQMESNKKGVFGWNQAIHAERRAAELFSVDDPSASNYRNI